jgi:hypothetical protein
MGRGNNPAISIITLVAMITQASISVWWAGNGFSSVNFSILFICNDAARSIYTKHRQETMINSPWQLENGMTLLIYLDGKQVQQVKRLFS